MTNETKPVLLTPEQVQRIWECGGYAKADFDKVLQGMGLIAPEPVDPLLIEAREIVIDTTPQPQRNFEIRKAEIRRGWKDDGFCVQIALAALRRGMELAKPELTREMVREAVDSIPLEDLEGAWRLRIGDKLHAALTEAQSK